jgi:hypothetical protein
MILTRDLKEFLELLNANRVEYLIVAGHALAFHGRPRYTGDIAILVRPSHDNAEKIQRALSQFGFGSLGLTSKDFLEIDQVVQLGVPPNRIDLLTSISGVGFDEAWKLRAAGTMDDIPVSFIGRESLIKNKRATGRPQDIVDAQMLGGD